MSQAEISDIYLDGRHYDRLFASGLEDPAYWPFWISQAQKYGGPILELACGTGRVTLVLAEHGYSLTGIDISDAMLGEAKRKSAQQKAAINWVLADMRDFDLGRRFSLIILLGNALGHLLDLTDFEGCLASVKKHLVPDGRFIIDYFNPSIELLINKPGERNPFSEYEDPDGRGMITVTESYVYERDTQIKRVKTHHAIPGEPETEGSLDLRMYFPQELDALLEYNGFEIENKYGGYDLKAFNSGSEIQLIVCKAA